MIEVYVWDFRGKREAWGHASMKVGNTYISYWPMAEGRRRSKLHDDIYSAHPRLPSYADDEQDESGRPDHVIRINGLDEGRIVAWWARVFPQAVSGFGPPSMAWSSLGWNCSKVVATALREGGADRFSTWMDSWVVGAWTPNDVRDYATSIARGLAR